MSAADSPEHARRGTLDDMSDITIFHNPACGTSRNVLALISNSGVEPAKGTPYEALKLDEAHWTDRQLMDFIVAHPILMTGRSWSRPGHATEPTF